MAVMSMRASSLWSWREALDARPARIDTAAGAPCTMVLEPCAVDQVVPERSLRPRRLRAVSRDRYVREAVVQCAAESITAIASISIIASGE